MSFALLIPILTGLVGGWLVNALADTLPATRRVSRPRCVHCAHEYPLGTYLTLRRCPDCGHDRGPRPWIVQALMLVTSIYLWIKPHQMGYALGMLLLTYFAVVIVIDVEHRLILHPTSAVGAVLGLGIGSLIHGPILTLLGGLAGFVIMLVLYYLGVLFSKFRARRMQAAGQEMDDEEALGAGDVILGGVLGLVLGWPLIWFGLLLGILLGGAIGAILLLALIMGRRYGKQAFMVFMPYGPFFVLSAFFILFLPNWIIYVVPR